jgi:alkylation response protein AidB-like acyl-CoA dehydrogenase
MTTTETRPSATLIDELTTWLEENWDPELTVGEWWERLGMAGWAAPMLPTNAYGRDLTRGDSMLVASTIARFGAMAAPMGMSIGLCSPTIATHGTQEQIDRLIPPAVTGKIAYCQLFSEPGAGSDLAGLTTKAVQDGEVSTARRCGPRAASTPTWACSSPAPTPTPPSTRASPGSPST